MSTPELSHPDASVLRSMRLENSNDVSLRVGDDDRVAAIGLRADEIYKLSVVFFAAVTTE